MPVVSIEDHVELNYEVTGNGPALVLCHGFADTLAVWDEQIPALASDYTVVRYDHRGHGESSAPPGPYRLRDLSTDLRGLLDALHIDRACVIGHSMGGRAMFQFVLDYPDRVWALVSVDAHSEPPQGEYLAKVLELRRAIEEGALERFFDLFVAAGEVSQRIIEDPILGPPYRNRFLQNRTAPLLSCLDAIVNMPRLTPRLADISVPMLAVVGEYDTPFLELAQHYKQSLSNCQIAIIPESKHCPQLDRPSHFNEVLLQFLNDIRPEL